MRVSGVFSLFGAIIVGLIIADLLSHPGVTNNLITAGTTESQLIAGK
jgi:hypothetical protein